MRSYLLLFCVLACQNPDSSTAITYVQTEEVKLSIPQVYLDSVLFHEKATLDIGHGLSGVDILFAEKGDDVTAQSQKMGEPVNFDKDFTIKAKAYHNTLQPSETVLIEGRKYFDPGVLKVKESTPPKAPYDQGTWALFFDGEKGGFNFRDGNWFGFQEDTLNFNIQLKEARMINELTVGTLFDPNSWIYHPERLEVYIEDDLKGTFEVDPLSIESSSRFQFFDVGVVPVVGDDINLKIISSSLPKGHPGEGQTAWVFIDEILIR